jgi:hypothetical protein
MDVMTEDTAALPGIGHNAPPPESAKLRTEPPLYDEAVFADLSARIDSFMAVSTEIRAKVKANVEAGMPMLVGDQPGVLADQISGLRGVKKQVESAQKEAKKPWADKATAAYDAFKPFLERLDKALPAMLGILETHIEAERVKAEAAKALERAVAEQAQRDADEAMKAAAASGDLDAEAEVERLREDAAKLQKSAAKDVVVNVASASGAGRTISQREVKTPELVNLNLLYMHYRDNPKVAECLLALATAECRAKDFGDGTIPGVTIKKTTVTV